MVNSTNITMPENTGYHDVALCTRLADSITEKLILMKVKGELNEF